MLRLRLLGSRELERADQSDASAVFAQPKRFALLAYMACRADRFHRRDTLLAVFWPELDTFAARRALRNSLYHLRLALGEDVFIARGDDELMIDRPKRLIPLAVIAVALLAWGGQRAWAAHQPYTWAGTVEARDIAVGSRVGGRVKEVLVREGDHVRANQPMVVLEPGTFLRSASRRVASSRRPRPSSTG